MHVETMEITKAIAELGKDNIWKDYIIPLALPLVSALFGFLIAWFTIWYQEKSKANSKNITTTNEWVLSAESAAQNLISLKQNYFDALEEGEGVGNARKSHPLFRLMVVPRIPVDTPTIEPPNKMSDLVFFLDALKAGENTDLKSWLNIPRLGAWRSNYLTAISIWRKRNEELDKYLPILSEFNASSFGEEVLMERIAERIGRENIEMLMDLTEQAIHITDILIKESNDILQSLPDLIKPIIKGPKGGAKLLKFGEMAVMRKRYSLKIADVDYELLAESSGRSPEDLRQRYQFWDY